MTSDNYRNSIGGERGERSSQVFRVYRCYASVRFIRKEAAWSSHEYGRELCTPPFPTRQFKGALLQMFGDSQPLRRLG